jgi:4-amino-4-deoxy-L-arabinose transferase-like glycosyltransferase
VGSPRQHSLLLFSAAALLLGVGLGGTDFWAPDEPRYGQVAEEVRAMKQGAKGLVLLHLGGEPYTQKPPLYYWLAALAGAGLGKVTEVAARIPSALAGIATVLVTYALGRQLFRAPGVALFGSALLLTNFRFAHLARRAQLDVLLTLFEAVAVLAFWKIDQHARAHADRPPPRQLLLLLHAMLGAAALTKGPVGWLPGLVIVVYLAWEGRLALLKRLLPAWGLLVSVGPVVLWILAATWLAPSGFFAEAVVDNLVNRVVDATSHVRPIYYYLYQLPLDFLPWTLLWPLAWLAGRQAWRTSPEMARPARLLVSWLLVPLVLFSLVSGKRGLYLLPAFPALALLCGAGIQTWLARSRSAPAWIRVSLLALAATIAGAGALIWRTGGFEWAGYPGFALSPNGSAAVGMAAALGLTAGLALRKRAPASLLAVTISTILALELVVFTFVYPSFDAEKSPRPVATLAARLTEPDETVGVFDDEGLAGGILYYGERNVKILPRAQHVQRFLAGGGRYVVLERWKLPWLDSVGRFQVHATTRKGRRELAIVSRLPQSESRSGTAWGKL